ncbi:minor capsid protein [bacterium]|nr:minor capsid protein [bacterium]
MSGALDHSPATIIRQWMVNESLATLPSAAGSWPASTAFMMDTPDNAIQVISQAGLQYGRSHIDGEIEEHLGVQVIVRSATHDAGYTKADAIKASMDTSSKLYTLTISSSTYTIYAITRRGNVLDLGTEPTPTNRHLFSINATFSVRKE